MGDVIQFRKPTERYSELEQLKVQDDEISKQIAEGLCVLDVLMAIRRGNDFIVDPYCPKADKNEYKWYNDKAKELGVTVFNPSIEE